MIIYPQPKGNRCFLNYGVADAEKKLIASSQDVINKFEEMQKNPDIQHMDPYTGKLISKNTCQTAKLVMAFFDNIAVPNKTF